MYVTVSGIPSASFFASNSLSSIRVLVVNPIKDIRRANDVIDFILLIIINNAPINSYALQLITIEAQTY